MEYIFIFESIGTSELMLIGLVALIVFGPRKIPDLARTFGKVMAEFRRSTDDFKKTWEQEAGTGTGDNSFEMGLNKFLGKTNETIPVSKNDEVITPTVKKISQEDFEKRLPTEKPIETIKVEEKTSDKREWL